MMKMIFDTSIFHWPANSSFKSQYLPGTQTENVLAKLNQFDVPFLRHSPTQRNHHCIQNTVSNSFLIFIMENVQSAAAHFPCKKLSIDSKGSLNRIESIDLYDIHRSVFNCFYFLFCQNILQSKILVQNLNCT